MRDGWIVLETFITQIEAEEARALLEARGLAALIQSDNCGGMRPHFDYSVGVKVLVRQEDAELARELVQPAGGTADAGSGTGSGADSGPEGTWLCAGCGEQVENSFGTCWRCGRDRD